MFQDSSRKSVAIFNQQAELNFADTRANFADSISRAEKEEKEREKERKEGRRTSNAIMTRVRDDIPHVTANIVSLSREHA